MYERTNDNNANINGAVNGKVDSRVNKVEDARSNSFLCKVYGIMFFMLLITFVIAYAVGLPLGFALQNAIESNNEILADKVITSMVAVLIISSIGLIVTSIIINVKAFTRSHSVIVPGILYAIFMGLLLASIVVVVNQQGALIIPAVFAVVCVMFGILYFITKLIKNIHWVVAILIGLVISLALLTGVGFLLYIFASPEFFATFVLIEVLIFVLFLFVTIYDIYNIQKIADSGCADKNIAFFCALSLYSDFIEIFLKVLRIVLIVMAKSKK